MLGPSGKMSTYLMFNHSALRRADNEPQVLWVNLIFPEELQKMQMHVETHFGLYGTFRSRVRCAQFLSEEVQ